MYSVQYANINVYIILNINKILCCDNSVLKSNALVKTRGKKRCKMCCMLLIFCCITVETINETVAALNNVTDFYSGECCRYILIQSPQCEPSPVLVPAITIPKIHTHF